MGDTTTSSGLVPVAETCLPSASALMTQAHSSIGEDGAAFGFLLFMPSCACPRPGIKHKPTFTHTSMHTHSHTHLPAQACTDTCTHKRTQAHKHTQARKNAHTRTYMCGLLNMSM